MKTVLISDNIDTLLGLKMVGVDGVLATNAEQVSAHFLRFTKDKNVGLILITEIANEMCADMINSYKAGNRFPLISVVPGRDKPKESTGSVTDYFNDAVL